MTAYQAIGINVSPVVDDYDPEPDVVVVDAELANKPEQRYAGRFYLAAEIVSASDRIKVESKREVYKLHEFCTSVLTVQQDRFEVRIDQRTDLGWSDTTLDKPDEVLVLAEFGVRCKVANLYWGTALLPRQARR